MKTKKLEGIGEKVLCCIIFVLQYKMILFFLEYKVQGEQQTRQNFVILLSYLYSSLTPLSYIYFSIFSWIQDSKRTAELDKTENELDRH